MIESNVESCPICNSSNTENLLDLKCGNIDGSPLYEKVRITSCNDCGHIYNRLTSQEIIGLSQYYNEEYAIINMSSTDNVGDRPGSKNYLTNKRYAQLFNCIKPYITKNYCILDIGCALGGFLDYLYQQDYFNLHGIDNTSKYVENAEHHKYSIKLGYAEDIPYDKEFFDVIIMDQVLEHLVEPVKAFKEAKRVLKNNGLLCIGVPNAAKYSETYFFDFYWFIMREHIQHFDIEHLKILAEREGFELVIFFEMQTPMMSESMILPNLLAIFRITNSVMKTDYAVDLFKLKKLIKRYIKENIAKISIKKHTIQQVINSQADVYFWGIGREFLFLYEQAYLKECNIKALIDLNPYKQKNVTVGGKNISDPSILHEASKDSVLFITAFAHIKAIKNFLQDIDFQGKVIDL